MKEVCECGHEIGKHSDSISYGNKPCFECSKCKKFKAQEGTFNLSEKMFGLYEEKLYVEDVKTFIQNLKDIIENDDSVLEIEDLLPIINKLAGDDLK